MDLKSFNEDYFEGILQLRNHTEELINYVENKTKKDKKALITNRLKVKNGYDFYFTSQRYLRNLGDKIKNNFPGELKKSRKLFTRKRQTSKDVYRVNVLFRMSNLKKGQVIDYKGDSLRVMNLGKKILAKNVKTGKKISLKYGDVT